MILSFICDVFNILHLDYLHNEKYHLKLKFLSIDDLENFNIENFLFKFNSYDPSFTKLELWYRFSFLFITLIVLILYNNSLKKYSLRDWSIEQKWIFILLRSLIFFNNPLLPLIVLVDSWIPHLLDAIFQSTFLALLMVFWLSIFHGFRHNDRNFTTFYIPKFVIVFSIWLISLFLLLWQQFRSLNDPSYNLSIDENYYFVFRILLFFFLVVYLLFLLYLMVRAVAELKKMPYFGIRIKFASIMMLIVIFSLLIIALMRLKSDSFKQSLFENFTKNYRNTTEFCALFSIINIYMYTLAYVYSPAKNASIDSDYADNPTFAMLNDTDEEDVLKNRAACNAKNYNFRINLFNFWTVATLRCKRHHANVCPHIEYTLVVWPPHTAKDSNILEKVQKVRPNRG
ncbi:transmembrane protein -like [Brachionus plicatilis]|uniref:Transmembrane protein-like n=1 Tax=Brachionus plicatilis TaxID=10195 RepID=A0A3M7RDD7_BRAPC|nr:transmembrane protein -like [Brachionus plicatilis]